MSENNMVKKKHWFQFVSIGFLVIFFGILLLTTSIAFMRKAGTTGIDMIAIQKLRYESMKK